MHHFWQLDEVLLAKAEEMERLFGIYPDMNKAARNMPCARTRRRCMPA